MNDQTRWRTDDAAPLQGKVTLEPAPSMASEAKPPAPARRLEEEGLEPPAGLDGRTEG
ncbi:TIGR01620 family protein, partial [Aeromonas caviae]